MSEVPVVISGVLADKYGRTMTPVTLMGMASIPGLEIGGGPMPGGPGMGGGDGGLGIWGGAPIPVPGWPSIPGGVGPGGGLPGGGPGGGGGSQLPETAPVGTTVVMIKGRQGWQVQSVAPPTIWPSPGRPDNSLPGDQPRPDNTLPGNLPGGGGAPMPPGGPTVPPPSPDTPPQPPTPTNPIQPTVPQPKASDDKKK